MKSGAHERCPKAPVVPDFLIGTHAEVHRDRLLARDRNCLRDYFSRLELLIPS